MIRFHRGRDAHYWAPAQIPAGVFHAPGLQKRASEKGTFSWGPKNKLALHRAGIPVDLFSATEDNWWNYVVCRPDHTRITFASRQPPSSAAGNGIPTARLPALAHSQASAKSTRSRSFLGLPYLQPWERN
jgi:hypothetical protein